jgi:hypothetical protein
VLAVFQVGRPVLVVSPPQVVAEVPEALKVAQRLLTLPVITYL